jgi:hypothetical protein
VARSGVDYVAPSEKLQNYFKGAGNEIKDMVVACFKVTIPTYN